MTRPLADLAPLSPRPDVTVVVCVRDGADHLRAAVASALAQADDDAFGALDVVIAVGPSQDDTGAIAAELAVDDRVQVVDNPTGRTPDGLNRAIAAASGEVIVRLDAHAVLPTGYVARAVEGLRRRGVVNVGGIQAAVGTTPVERAVAAAVTHPMGAGDATFRTGGEPGPTDTVYLGVFRRDALTFVGGYDERLTRNQDYELNWRLREAGGTVWFDPGLVVTYRPRGSWRSLSRQYHEYGRWKRVTVTMAPRSLRLRQVVPAAATVANLAALAAAVVTRRAAPLAVPAIYATALGAAATTVDAGSARRRDIATAWAIIHHAWGLGFLVPARLTSEDV